MTGWKAFGHSLARILLGLVACEIAAWPCFRLVIFLRDLIEGVPLLAAAGDMLYIDPERFFPGYAKLSLGILPFLILIAFVMYVLGRRDNDSFGYAVSAGTVIGCVAATVTASALIDRGPGLNALGLLDAASIFLLSAMLNVVYWLTAIRPIRRMRAFHRQHRAAIQAME